MKKLLSILCCAVILLSVSSCTKQYVNPVVAVILGVAFAHENISLLQLGGLLVILVSVLLINWEKYRRVRKTEKSGSPKEAAVVDC